MLPVQNEDVLTQDWFLLTALKQTNKYILVLICVIKNKAHDRVFVTPHPVCFSLLNTTTNGLMSEI